MKLSEAETRKWVRIYSDELMHFNEEDFEYVVSLGQMSEIELLPNDAGFIAYVIIKDFDCKKKLNVVTLYCKPEYRGRYLRYMFRKIEEIAKQEGVARISIGGSISGYKQEKFDRMLGYFGYTCDGYRKEI